MLITCIKNSKGDWRVYQNFGVALRVGKPTLGTIILFPMYSVKNNYIPAKFLQFAKSPKEFQKLISKSDIVRTCPKL